MCFPLEISNPDSTRYLKSSSFFNFDQLIATSPCNSWLIFHLFGKILFNPLKEKRDQMKCTFGINDGHHSYGFTTPIAGKRSSSLVYDLHLFSWWRKELALGHRCCARHRPTNTSRSIIWSTITPITSLRVPRRSPRKHSATFINEK